MKKQSRNDLGCLSVLTPAGAYVLGWAATDGSVCTSKRHSVGWELSDREPLEIIKTACKSDREIEDRGKYAKWQEFLASGQRYKVA